MSRTKKKSKQKKPRDYNALSAKSRSAGPLKDKRKKRVSNKLHKDLEEIFEYEDDGWE